MVVEVSFKFCLTTATTMSGSAIRCYDCFIHNGALETFSIQCAAFLLPAVGAVFPLNEKKVQICKNMSGIFTGKIQQSIKNVSWFVVALPVY